MYVVVRVRLAVRACVCVCSRARSRAHSRHSSRLQAAAAGRQAAVKLSNCYDVYDAIMETPCSPDSVSDLSLMTPTSIVKHSELLNALPPAEYVPMQVSAALLSLHLVVR